MYTETLISPDARELIRRLRERGRFHVITPNRFIKVYWREQRAALGREMAAARYIPDRLPWKSVNLVFNRTLLPFGLGTIAHARRIRGRLPHPGQCRTIAAVLLSQISPGIPRVPWFETVGAHVTESILPALEIEMRMAIDRSLSGITLPHTGAHGDLKDVNLLVDSNDDFSIIDWEFFRPEGSAIEDICRLLAISVRTERLQAGLSFVPGEDTWIIWRSHVMRWITAAYSLTEMQAILLEIISRASCEYLGGRNLRSVTADLSARVNAFFALNDAARVQPIA